MKPFITAHPQTVSSMVIDIESVTKGGEKGRKCCFNNLGLKHILLYASKGFNKKKNQPVETYFLGLNNNPKHINVVQL